MSLSATSRCLLLPERGDGLEHGLHARRLEARVLVRRGRDVYRVAMNVVLDGDPVLEYDFNDPVPARLDVGHVAVRRHLRSRASAFRWSCLTSHRGEQKLLSRYVPSSTPVGRSQPGILHVSSQVSYSLIAINSTPRCLLSATMR